MLCTYVFHKELIKVNVFPYVIHNSNKQDVILYFIPYNLVYVISKPISIESRFFILYLIKDLDYEDIKVTLTSTMIMNMHSILQLVLRLGFPILVFYAKVSTHGSLIGL